MACCSGSVRSVEWRGSRSSTPKDLKPTRNRTLSYKKHFLVQVFLCRGLFWCMGVCPINTNVDFSGGQDAALQIQGCLFVANTPFKGVQPTRRICIQISQVITMYQENSKMSTKIQGIRAWIFELLFGASTLKASAANALATVAKTQASIQGRRSPSRQAEDRCRHHRRRSPRQAAVRRRSRRNRGSRSRNRSPREIAKFDDTSAAQVAALERKLAALKHVAPAIAATSKPSSTTNARKPPPKPPKPPPPKPKSPWRSKLSAKAPTLRPASTTPTNRTGSLY